MTETAMTKTDILLYGAILESDMYEGGYGSTDEDTELLRKALKKIYGVTEETSEEDVLMAEERMNDDMKNLVVVFRCRVAEYLGAE